MNGTAVESVVQCHICIFQCRDGKPILLTGSDGLGCDNQVVLSGTVVSYWLFGGSEEFPCDVTEVRPNILQDNDRAMVQNAFGNNFSPAPLQRLNRFIVIGHSKKPAL